MHRLFRAAKLSVLGGVIFLTACGGNDSPPVPLKSTISPTTQPTVAVFAIFGPDLVRVGASASYIGTATLSDGTLLRNPTSVTWSVDNSEVATIDANGVLTAIKPGEVTITATYEGKTASERIRVPVSNGNPGGANMVISYVPDPVPGSPARCKGFDPSTPTWSYKLILAETQGVGFTLKVYTWYLFDDNGSVVYSDSFPEEEYFAPNSVFEEDVCTSLAGGRSGYTEDIMDGVDDRGNWLTFVTNTRLRLLPVTASPASSPTSFAPIAPRGRPLLRRVR
jgi:Bacterial Ig-like domain (group 2)